MNTNIKNFLYSIGKTNIYKENFLSDITYAKCQSNEEFLYSFFHFCFPEETSIKINYIEREKTEKTENSRNDFQFQTTKGTYIVENKINDKDTTKVKKYLDIVKSNSHIAYMVPRQYDEKAIKVLKQNYIGYFLWEDFIDNISRNEKFSEYCIIASAILKYNLPIYKKPTLEDIKDKISICDRFFKDKLKNTHSITGEIGEWGTNHFYGHFIWASAWFGLAFCPIKGVYFCFAIGPGGDKTVKINKMHEYLKPLGEYYKDGYYYYEIKDHDILDHNNYIKILTSAFSEFGETIILDIINLPLNIFIEKVRSNN